MLYPQPQHFMPAPYPNPMFPEFPGLHPSGADPDGVQAPLAVVGSERLNTQDRIFLAGLCKRRRLNFPADSVWLSGFVAQRENYTIAVIGLLGRPKCIGIAKRNPAADAPDAGRGRRIALARALFDLLQAEGRTTEPETATEC